MLAPVNAALVPFTVSEERDRICKSRPTLWFFYTSVFYVTSAIYLHVFMVHLARFTKMYIYTIDTNLCLILNFKYDKNI